MAYTPTNWVDGVTPVNAVNLNKLEQGLAAAVGIPADVVVPAASFLIRNKFAAPDANPAFRMMGDGKIEWGSGGTSAPDVNLYRSKANELATDDSMWIAGSTAIQPSLIWTEALLDLQRDAGSRAVEIYDADDVHDKMEIFGDGKIQWGQGNIPVDTNLYRASANLLRSDDNFQAATLISDAQVDVGTIIYAYKNASPGAAVLAARASADANWRFIMDASGSLNWGDGTAAQDTYLVRTGVNYLVTNATLSVAQALIFGGELYQSTAKFFVDSGGSLQWGPGDWSRDTNLYRSGVGVLATASAFNVGQTLNVASYATIGGDIGARWASVYQLFLGSISGGGATVAGINFGNAGDTNLYRRSADNLQTDDSLWVGNSIVVDANNGAVGANKIYFGGLLDTQLYRAAAGVIKSDGQMQANGFISLVSSGAPGFHHNPSVGTGYALYSSVAADTQPSFYADWKGQMGWGPGGSAPIDTNLYRGGVGFLKTDGGILAASWFQVQDPTNGMAMIGSVSAGKTGLSLGPVGSYDTWFYRAGPGVWHTDQQIEVYGGIKFSDGSVQTTAAGGMTLIQEITLGATGRFDFSSIPSTYRHLRIVLAARSASGAANDNVSIRFNGDNAANYDRQQLAGTGGSPTAAAGTATNDPIIGVIPGGAAPASVPGIGWVEIPHYKGTTFHKGFTSMIGYRDSSSPGEQVNSGLWRSTAAINRIQIDVLGFGNSIAAGSVATLYGIA